MLSSVSSCFHSIPMDFSRGEPSSRVPRLENAQPAANVADPGSIPSAMDGGLAAAGWSYADRLPVAGDRPKASAKKCQEGDF